MNKLAVDPYSKLVLPRQFIDEKVALKKTIDDLIDKCVLENQHLKDTYFLIVHAKFDAFDPTKFNISTPVISFKLPPFVSNQMIFWVCNKQGICEILWMVTRGKDKKLKVDFNKKGVAALRMKHVCMQKQA